MSHLFNLMGSSLSLVFGLKGDGCEMKEEEDVGWLAVMRRKKQVETTN